MESEDERAMFTLVGASFSGRCVAAVIVHHISAALPYRQYNLLAVRVVCSARLLLQFFQLTVS